MKEKIKEKFIEVYKMDIKPEELLDDSYLFGPDSVYGIDSMDVLVFINELKKEFGLEYSTLDTDSFMTINNIISFIEKQKKSESV